MGARLFLTGGAGLIGSHLAEAWQARGGRVRVLDDFSTGRRENLAALDPARLELVEGCLLEGPSPAELLEGVDAVAHLASVVGVERVLHDPARTWRVGVEGSRRVLEAAAERRLPLVLASSSEVYGRREDVPFRETDALGLGSPEHPRWVYAAAKAAAESLTLALARAHRQRVAVVRLFNVSGARQRPESGMVLPTFARAARRGEPLRVHGDGTQRRCFCHAEDVAQALLGLLDAAPEGGEVLNVGGEREISMGELARLVLARAGGASPIEFAPHTSARGGREGDTARRLPDLSRIAARTGWRARRSLEELVDDVLAGQGSD